ncbi:alpha/beta hydrolase [Pseudorhodoplanes sinuspersici]|uniref:Esterase n=1 Tax=Pseudorhodoplanes sinuspersici TaxID=1235591 RepID=A0A1W6ZVN7_9HYPH|nr:alpha/beta hydrolase [Pseudorhodoplanes sinuspersici]ARQ01373.1 esterase [Pseudorhodoplanes sinuspersici]RKE73056.1 triacylglycerol lipase [Pseudorhodoplanes sinuspersici]
MSPDIAAQIAAIGRVIDPAKTGAIYAAMHDKEPYPGVTVVRNIQYGPAERNILDVFTAQGATGTRPVLVFVHGGGFTGGNKHTPGTPYYDNVPLWAARNGLVGVNITYRLAPEGPWPAGAQDVGAAVRWVIDNIATFGGDPSKIILFGHSAGATHAGTYAAMPQFHGPRGISLTGLILTSGIYDMTTFPLTDNYRSYIGDDASLYAERSPINGLDKLGIPSMLVYAERDPGPFVSQFEKLAAAMANAPGGKPRTLLLDQHSHLSLGYSIGTDDTALTGPILEFIKSLK